MSTQPKVWTEEDLSAARVALRDGEPPSTILTAMSLVNWVSLRNAARFVGQDSVVHKNGNGWCVHELIPGRPCFKTKRAAYEFVTNLIQAESYHRLWEADRKIEGGPDRWAGSTR